MYKTLTRARRDDGVRAKPTRAEKREASEPNFVRIHGRGMTDRPSSSIIQMCRKTAPDPAMAAKSQRVRQVGGANFAVPWRGMTEDRSARTIDRPVDAAARRDRSIDRSIGPGHSIESERGLVTRSLAANKHTRAKTYIVASSLLWGGWICGSLLVVLCWLLVGEVIITRRSRSVDSADSDLCSP
jgi:hypothetical protein